MKTVNETADDLKNILLSSRTRETSLIYLIMGTTRDERGAIRDSFDRQNPSAPLDALIDHKLSGSFKLLVSKLFYSRAESDTEEVIRAFKGYNPDEETVFEIMFNRPNALRQEIAQLFEQKTGNSLLNKVNSEFHKYTKEPLFKLIQMIRDESGGINESTCTSASDLLKNTDPNEWVKNDDTLEVFGKSTPGELIKIGRLYKEATGNHILDVIDNLKSKHVRCLLKTLYYVVANPAEYYALKINESVKGLGTDEEKLARIIVSRYDLDMMDIKRYYFDNFNETVKEAIEDDCSGSFKRLLVGLINSLSNYDY